MVNQYSTKRKKNSPKTVHLVGTDRPEATMIYAGFYHEILASNPLHPIKLTLISPDEANQQLAKDCSPSTPMLINPKCKLTAWDGFYHDFWDKYVNRYVVFNIQVFSWEMVKLRHFDSLGNVLKNQILSWAFIQDSMQKEFMSFGNPLLTFSLTKISSQFSPF